jgi:hypothetical protein
MLYKYIEHLELMHFENYPSRFEHEGKQIGHSLFSVDNNQYTKLSIILYFSDVLKEIYR